jgi:hypothetical protein
MAKHEQNPSDPAPDESFVAAWSSSNHDAEMESLSIKGLLSANGIPAMVVGPQILPNLEFQIQVPAHMLNEAERVIGEARRVGRQAASEDEAVTE